MRILIRTIFFLLIFVANSLASTPISIFKDWTLFKSQENGKEICYIASLPINKEGNYKKRGEPYATVMREKGAKYDEISVSSGFLYDPDKDIEISILKRKFPLFPNDEKAWTYDRNDDIEIVKQMKIGNKMYILSYSKSGNKAIDTYSLIGFSEAYEQMISLCK
ncbi:MAG TPA: invasion associated locus B family protein [Rickettsiales bacterium]|nr:invasion associated locus B family protein [Rickettsiales bacterium]